MTQTTPARLRIGLNLLYLIPNAVGGTESYAAGLLSGLAAAGGEHEFVAFVAREAADWPLPEGGASFRRIVCDVPAQSRARRYTAEQLFLPRLLDRERVDLVHSLGYVRPLLARQPSVVTIHDVNFRAYPMPLMRKTALRFFVRRSANGATRVIAPSHFSKSEICDEFDVAPERVVVIHEAPRLRNCDGAGDSEIAARLRGTPYIAAFSSRFPHKNIPRLLRAFARVAARRDVRLVLIGHHLAEWCEQLETLGLKDRVVFTGFVSDHDVTTVLRGATLLVFPSWYEGFGLPVLEAMELGVPVVCSNRGSLPEVAGDAAVLFDPMSEDEIAVKLEQVLEDETLRGGMQSRGYVNLSRFSWRAAAEQTLGVYRDAIAAHN